MKTIFVSELLTDIELEECISKTGCGIELISFSIGENLDNFDDVLSSVKSRLKVMNPRGVTLHGPFLDLNPMSFDSHIKKATRYRFEQAYEAADKLGAGKIVFHSGMIPSVCYLEGWAERMADFWNCFMDGRKGITVCMENVLDPEIWPFVEVAEKVESPDFGICLDLGHAHCYSEHDVRDWAEKLLPYIRHVHVHDNNGKKDEHLGACAGTVPLGDCFDILMSGADDMSFCAECSTLKDAVHTIEYIGANLK